MDRLPRYTVLGTSGSTKHTFNDDNSTLCVHVFSHAASKDSPPIFHDESIVSGSLEFTVKDGPFSAVKSVTAEVVGVQRIMRGFGLRNMYDPPFMSLQQIVWESDATHSKLPPGRTELPFELALPKTVRSISKKAPNELIALPPSFSAPGFPIFLVYELRCTVAFKLLREDAKLTIPITYVPRKEAGAPAPSRALAYETRTPPADPTVDPEAWHSESAEVSARVFGVRDVRLSCTLSLPLPLEYARGYYIPFHLAVTCADAQTVDLLSTHGAFGVLLDRQARLSDTEKRASEAKEGLLNTVARARYWPVQVGGTDEMATRRFEGEIRVPAQLMQSFAYPRLSLSYSVQLHVEAPGVVGEHALLHIPVEITYFPASDSPRPISYAPPLRPGEEEGSRYVESVQPLMFVNLQSE